MTILKTLEISKANKRRMKFLKKAALVIMRPQKILCNRQHMTV